MDAVLQVGAVSETVTVNGQASVIETDTSEHSQVIGTQAIVELPLNGRDYASLALLATNVHISPVGIRFSPNATPREGAFNVNGMRSTYNNFLLDGVDNNSYGTSNQNYSSQVVQPSPDALAEFRVITSNFSAEYGRVGGGVINAALRSGTNQFHGTAYEFLRNTDLNAIGYIFGARPATFLKPTLHRNQFGVTIGGPHHQEQAVLLRRLRRLPADAGLSQFLFRSEHQRPQRDLAGHGGQSAHRRGLSRPARRFRSRKLNPFAAAALAGLACRQWTR